MADSDVKFTFIVSYPMFCGLCGAKMKIGESAGYKLTYICCKECFDNDE